MTRTFLVCAAMLAATAAHAAGTTKITVNGMVCAFCAQGIEKRLTALPQTQGVYVNLAQKIVAVEAKPGQAHDEAQLRNEIRDAGYDVVRVEAVAQPLSEVRASLKGGKR
jgi:cation transport ATPase